MIDVDSYVGFQLANGIRIVFHEDPKKSLEFENEDFEKVQDAIKILQQISFKVTENENAK